MLLSEVNSLSKLFTSYLSPTYGIIGGLIYLLINISKLISENHGWFFISIEPFLEHNLFSGYFINNYYKLNYYIYFLN